LIGAADKPDVVSTDTETVLANAARAGLLPAADADVLLPAHSLLASLLQILRLCMDEIFDPAAAPAPLLKRLAEAADMPDFRSLDAHVRATEAAVRASLERVIGKLPPRPPT
jgi:glutamate-ammonia-ligase adenylyltransferase